MVDIESILQGVPDAGKEKARKFIEKHGLDAYKKVRNLEVYNLEEAWNAVRDCSGDELVLVAMLIRDAYGMSLEEIVAKLKENGVKKTRSAFVKLKKEGKRFTSADVFGI